MELPGWRSTTVASERATTRVSPGASTPQPRQVPSSGVVVGPGSNTLVVDADTDSTGKTHILVYATNQGGVSTAFAALRLFDNMLTMIAVPAGTMSATALAFRDMDPDANEIRGTVRWTAPADPTGHPPAAAPPHHMGSGEPAPSAALIVPRSLLEEINEDVEAGYLAEAKEPPPPRPQSRERPHSRGPAAKAAARAARKSRAPPPAATPPPSPPGVYASGGGGGGGEDDGGSSEWRQPRRTPQVDEYTKMQALEMQRRAQRQMEAELKKRGQKRGGTLASLKKGYFELAVALRLRPAPKAATLAAVMVEAKLQGKRKALRWRSPRVYLLRMAAAWAFNLLVLLICLLLALAYAIRLVPIQANNMLLVWLVSYGWTFAFLEPVKILLLAGIPGLWNEKTRLGRTLLRCRFLYNELCAP